MAQTIFQRIEKKYMIPKEKQDALLSACGGRLTPDKYGEYTITNLYYDTADYALIRASIEKPFYKEKLRLRSYGGAGSDTSVFLELKKKFDGVVYKRRAVLPYGQVRSVLTGGAAGGTQILSEIGYFLEQHDVSEKAFIAYDRTAFSGAEDPGLRVTFDTNIRFRQTDLRLDGGIWGTEILPPGMRLLEIKVPGVMPLWLAHILSELRIFPSSYSKYGTCYKAHILPAQAKRREAAHSA
ncbi:polyphosphate polymerase domain-containing protein [Oscillospiraceae bacterium OttesenSCG-928-F05]|nr:polyphosphate polymerase domain-containing protein [Oscillospiraceae bacterium OttesenSCG-928-F05]